MTPTPREPLEWIDAPGHTNVIDKEEAWKDTGERWAIWHYTGSDDDSGYQLSTLTGQSYATIATCGSLEAAKSLAQRLQDILDGRDIVAALPAIPLDRDPIEIVQQQAEEDFVEWYERTTKPAPMWAEQAMEWARRSCDALVEIVEKS